LIMLMAVASTVLSLYQVKLMPETYQHVVMIYSSAMPQQDFSSFKSKNPMSEDRDRGLNKQQQKEMVHMILKELGVAVSQDPMPAASLLSSPTEWNVGTLLNLSTIQALLQRRKRGKLDDDDGSLPPYFEDIFFFTQKSLYVSMAAGLIGFLSSLVGICGGVFRVPRCLKLSVAGVLLVMLAEMATAGFIFVAHDKIMNRNHYQDFDELIRNLCEIASVCVNPMMLVMVGSFLIASVVLQVPLQLVPLQRPDQSFLRDIY